MEINGISRELDLILVNQQCSWASTSKNGKAVNDLGKPGLLRNRQPPASASVILGTGHPSRSGSGLAAKFLNPHLQGLFQVCFWFFSCRSAILDTLSLTHMIFRVKGTCLIFPYIGNIWKL